MDQPMSVSPGAAPARRRHAFATRPSSSARRWARASPASSRRRARSPGSRKAGRGRPCRDSFRARALAASRPSAPSAAGPGTRSTLIWAAHGPARMRRVPGLERDPPSATSFQLGNAHPANRRAWGRDPRRWVKPAAASAALRGTRRKRARAGLSPVHRFASVAVRPTPDGQPSR